MPRTSFGAFLTLGSSVAGLSAMTVTTNTSESPDADHDTKLTEPGVSTLSGTPPASGAR